MRTVVQDAVVQGLRDLRARHRAGIGQRGAQRALAGDDVLGRLDETVGVENHGGAGGNGRGAGVSVVPQANAQRQTAGRKVGDGAVGRADQRRRMSRRDVRQGARDRVEHADERGYDVVEMLRLERAVGGVDDGGGIGIDLRHAADDLTHGGHDHRCLQAAAGDVADRDQHAPIGQAQRIIPISADLRLALGRFVYGVENDPGDLRQLLRQERALQRRGDMVRALVRGQGLVVLLQRVADSLRHLVIDPVEVGDLVAAADHRGLLALAQPLRVLREALQPASDPQAEHRRDEQRQEDTRDRRYEQDAVE